MVRTFVSKQKLLAVKASMLLTLRHMTHPDTVTVIQELSDSFFCKVKQIYIFHTLGSVYLFTTLIDKLEKISSKIAAESGIQSDRTSIIKV